MRAGAGATGVGRWAAFSSVESDMRLTVVALGALEAEKIMFCSTDTNERGEIDASVGKNTCEDRPTVCL